MVLLSCLARIQRFVTVGILVDVMDFSTTEPEVDTIVLTVDSSCFDGSITSVRMQVMILETGILLKQVQQ